MYHGEEEVVEERMWYLLDTTMVSMLATILRWTDVLNPSVHLDAAVNSLGSLLNTPVMAPYGAI